MGVLDKFISYMNLNDNEEDEYNVDEDYLDDDEDEEEKVQPVKKGKPSKREEAEEEDQQPPVKRVPQKISSIKPAQKRMPIGDGMEVCVIRPTNVDEAREITDTLLSKRTVVLNLEGLDVEIAQRIIDFTSGSCYAIRGNLQKISHYIFIITPESVDISGDFSDIFNTGSSFESPINEGY